MECGDGKHFLTKSESDERRLRHCRRLVDVQIMEVDRVRSCPAKKGRISIWKYLLTAMITRWLDQRRRKTIKHLPRPPYKTVLGLCIFSSILPSMGLICISTGVTSSTLSQAFKTMRRYGQAIWLRSSECEQPHGVGLSTVLTDSRRSAAPRRCWLFSGSAPPPPPGE